METPFEKLLGMVREAAREHVPLAQALEKLRQRGLSELPAAVQEVPTWTPEQERALAEVIRADTSPCAWMDSLEILQMMRGWQVAEGQVSSPGSWEFAAWPAGIEENVSSPSGGPPGEKGFWFNVNVELVIYGATERDATVTIGGRKIALRPDGTFSVRFALPDGHHELAVLAVSADETDVRVAELKFDRATQLAGDVGTHPEDPALDVPGKENV
jgi:hypothetical protein